MTETPTPDEPVVAADENPIVAAVREGAAPSYDSGALTVDEQTGAPVLAAAPMPQLTMPELQGLEEPVVPEGDPTAYGLEEDEEARAARQSKEEKAAAKAEKDAAKAEKDNNKS